MIAGVNMKKVLLCLSILAFASMVGAEERRQAPGEGEGRGTPPFVTACSSLSAGASCSFTGRSGSSESGTCQSKTNPRTNSAELICVTAEMEKMGPPPGHH